MTRPRRFTPCTTTKVVVPMNIPQILVPLGAMDCKDLLSLKLLQNDTVLQAMNTWGVIMLCSIGLSQPRNSDRDFARSQLPQKLRYIIIYSFKHYKIKIIYYYIMFYIVLTF